ncbi:hypothetical protein [Sphingopyxis flava]|uniref:Uncharacterized protein n=1 Tax=Sphingopyxis flava TaxID=1507287 RepID=A0A1T5ACL1_9SPHN|nr:hypothetical protein [Sphingopyxis flava]SKB32635.1 hypothetical protein SAMN06295937_100396 [Sphingopyxis flava]
MDRHEMISLLQQAHNEIMSLRHEIAELAPKAHAYDTIAAVTRMKPAPEQGYTVDLAWRLAKAVEELDAEREAERVPAEDGA